MTLNQIKKIFFTVTCFVIILGSVNAQDSQTLYYMNRVPQATMMNPAMQPACNFFLGLPVVSSLQLDVGNNRLALTDIIMKHPTQDSLITFLHPDATVNTIDFLNKLGENNFFYEDFRTDLLSFGFRLDSWYFSFNLSERLSSSINYPKDLMELALEGNSQFINTNADLSYLGINSSFYREYGLGISKEINQNLSVGIRVKVLFGHANITSDYNENSFTMYSSRDSIYLNADAVINTSSPLIATTNADGDFESFELPGYIENADTDSLIDLALAHTNTGFGVDFGVYYKPIDKLSLSLSVIDLGYIKWNAEDVTNLELKGSYSFTGVDVSSEIGGTDTVADPFDDMIDSLTNCFTISNNSDSYTTGLGAKIYIGGNYAVSKKFDVGFLSRTYFYNSNLNQAFTFSANVRPINGLSASLSYSIMNGTYNNIGFGLVLGGAPLQLYVVTDNASAALWGHETSSFNFRFGLNVAFGCRQKTKTKDTPMLKSVF
ncbi:MAG: hypothetical protein KOO66_04435 [Bacteroidales bacterium]|nr:hypothetical protein [Bacteroidales bacterium]